MPQLPIAYPLIRGRRHSWASIEVSILDTVLRGVLSIDYEDGQEPGMPRGTDNVALGMTEGRHKFTGSMKLLRAEFEVLTDKLGPGFMRVPFDIVVNYFEEGIGVITDEIQGVRITNVKSSNSDSTDGSAMDLTLMTVVPIKWNGKPGTISTFA